jgi:hypothetical protein
MPILDIQQRFAEVGRIRAGAKGTKGQPQKLDAWRLTSANRVALDAAANLYGGNVQEWNNAPTPGQFELFTESRTLDVMVPPSHEPYSLWYEAWTGGGCEHRCDGVRDHLNDQPCSCNPDNRTCKPTLRVSLALHRIPGLGVWRYESHGFYAATELPATLDLLAGASARGQYLTGYLRLDDRATKTKANGTRRFLVPALDLEHTIGELAGISPTSSPSQLAAPAGPGLATSPPAGALPTPILATDDEKRALWNAAQAVGMTVDDLVAALSALRGEDEADLGTLRADEVGGLLLVIEAEATA